MIVRLAVAACLAVPACAEPATTVMWRQEICPTDECGANSPVIDGVPFWELHRFGLANAEGFRLTGFRDQYGLSLVPDVVGTELVGRDARGNIVLSGGGLSAATFDVEATTGETYEVHIAEMGSMSFWAQPTGAPPAPAMTYFFTVTGGSIADGPQPLCATPPDAGGWPGGNPLHAFVFTGDRYDLATKEVMIGGDAAEWMSIACAGSAPAKMLLTRHAEAAAIAGHPTTQPQRQAMFRMFTSAVCGTASLTIAGEPLRYRDSQGLMTTTWADVDTHEALWSERGAVCLDIHRLAVPDADKQLAAAILDDLDAACGGQPPPPCSAVGLPGSDWRDLGYVQSMNPIGS
jgi:hypothetical protein